MLRYGAHQCVSNRVQAIEKNQSVQYSMWTITLHTTEYFKFPGVLKLRDMYKLNLCTMLFKYLFFSDTFSNNLRLTSDLHNYSTRNNNRNNLIVQNAIQAVHVRNHTIILGGWLNGTYVRIRVSPPTHC